MRDNALASHVRLKREFDTSRDRYVLDMRDIEPHLQGEVSLWLIRNGWTDETDKTKWFWSIDESDTKKKEQPNLDTIVLPNYEYISPHQIHLTIASCPPAAWWFERGYAKINDECRHRRIRPNLGQVSMVRLKQNYLRTDMLTHHDGKLIYAKLAGPKELVTAAEAGLKGGGSVSFDYTQITLDKDVTYERKLLKIANGVVLCLAHPNCFSHKQRGAFAYLVGSYNDDYFYGLLDNFCPLPIKKGWARRLFFDGLDNNLIFYTNAMYVIQTNKEQWQPLIEKVAKEMW